MKKIMVFGTFDHLHPGHEFVLHEAAKRGKVTVIVARSANVKRIKGKASVQSEDVRMQTLQSRFPMLTVLLGDKHDYLAPVRTIKPDLILLGYDQKLPPDVRESDLPCPIERLPAFHPELYKSSLLIERRK